MTGRETHAIRAAAVEGGVFAFLVKPFDDETFHILLPNGLYIPGGGSGIRTHGSLRISGFQDRRDRPLCHPSYFGSQTLSDGVLLDFNCAKLTVLLPVVARIL